MAAFGEALTDCSLLDMGFNGPPFTWSNKREHHALVRATLDRCVVNSRWLHLFLGAILSHLIVASSDHMGLLLDSKGASNITISGRRKQKLFRFEKAWLREPGCEDVITHAWDVDLVGTTMYRVSEK